MKHVIGWVEIPVSDIERAAKFYGALYEQPPLAVYDDRPRKTAMLPGASTDPNAGQVGASLTQVDGFEPSANGTLAYLQVDDLDAFIGRIAAAGGQVVMPRTSMGENMGYFATFRDSEGNTLALYAEK